MTAAANPLSALHFRQTWRPYQSRVLAAVREHLSDRRLHVVAAPGAGKTTLGLEIARLLSHPALVLAPSRTIRDQWIARLRDFRPEHAPPPAWAGTSLGSPTVLTAITYQALHTTFRADADADADDESSGEPDAAPTEAELNAVVAHCRAVGVGTVILDEAHHLRQEWWRALAKLRQAIGDPVLVCLTATPPYDVVSLEWRRYEELCGPIDEEISVPELVRAGTLCPHQDYVWACAPSAQDITNARRHGEAVAAFMADLGADAALDAAVRSHAWIAHREVPAEVVLDDPEFAVALLAFLRLRGHPPPETLLELLGTTAADVPTMDRRWWTALLARYLFGEDWPESVQPHRDALARRMRQLGLLHRRDLRLLRHAGLQAGFSQSGAKIAACLAVHRLERRLRGADLRQVILTDYIREGEPDRLGAWSVFHQIVTAADPADARGVALLTGRLAIVPDELVPELRAAVPGITPSADEARSGFTRIAEGGRVTDFLTQCLGTGRLHTLVGSRALLGEGWDCPAVNSLVLASFVGSFMTTNQMRGRAIRVDPAQPHKAASIWHLVAVDPATSFGRVDVAQLEERFETFAGLHATQPAIESGLKRLELPPLRQAADLETWNAESTRRAERFAELEARWRTAVERGIEHRILAAVEAKPPPKQRRFVFNHTLRYLLFSAVSAFLAGAESVLGRLRPDQWQNDRRVWVALLVAGVAGLVVSLPLFLKWFWIWLRHLPADGSLKQIAEALLEALVHVRAITSPRDKLALRCEEVTPGCFSVALAGGTFYESSLFADSLAVLLGPIENPRYLVTRLGGGFWRSQREDFHAVPPVLAAKKEHAEIFHRHWRSRVGAGDLIPTRTPEGRQALLRARVRAFSDAFADPARRRDRWG